MHTNSKLAGSQDLKKSDRTRKHLLEISLEAFEKGGYDNCTMRDLAKKAGVTAPAFYYYFRSKEEIVAAFYTESLQRHLSDGVAGIVDGAPLVENLKTVTLQRLTEFSGSRETLSVLKRFALDRRNVLSPFHDDHRSIRADSVGLFVQMIDRTRLNPPVKIKRELAQLFWLFHLLILFYWIGDESSGSKKTKELLERSLAHISAALLILRVPGAYRTLATILETLKRAGLLEDL